MNLNKNNSFDDVEPPIEDSTKWMYEYGTVEIKNHGIELVWSIHSSGIVAAGKGGFLYCQPQ